MTSSREDEHLHLLEKARISINTYRYDYSIGFVGRGGRGTGAFVTHKQQFHIFLVIPVGWLAREAYGGTEIHKNPHRLLYHNP